MCCAILSNIFCLLIFFTSFVVSRVIETTPSSDNLELKLVHVIFRHGERTPTGTYPNDIYINHTFYPYGWAQLTNIGKEKMYQTGQFLRERYDKFLGELYSPLNIYAQSTSTDRTLASCALVLAGLWPPKGTPLEWNAQLNWTPIPIRSELLNEDTLLLARKNCPRYFEELENVYKTETVSLLHDNEELLKELSQFSGNKIQTPHDVYSLYSTLDTEIRYGVKLPNWTDNYFPNKFLDLAEESFYLSVYNNELKRLKAGPILKKVLEDWELVITNHMEPKARKLFVYCGHDSTIANILLALGIWDKQIPSYGIMVMFELSQKKDTQEYGVEIYLRNSTSETPHILTIPGCESWCSVSKIMELTIDVIPLDWSEECKAKNPTYIPPVLGEP